jgi:ABC-type Fe3+/spermidine/putrescine transport system ATPase subunit
MREAYVELVALHKRFASLAAVSDVNLAVPEGQVTTLLGPSGCGKTTILRLIAGFLQPDSGDIRIKGERVNDIPPQRRGAVVVFQDYALFPHLSVFENVAYGLRRRRVRGPELKGRVESMLTFLGLADQAAKSPLQLSGGQQQRVALARALVVEPDVLLLDEPLSNLDVKLRVRVRTELKEIQRSLGKTTILVTHDQEEALSISDRIAVVEAGRIRQVGTPYEVYARPVDAFVADFLGIANFLPATVLAVTPGSVLLDTPIGRLLAEASGFVAGDAVTVLLRPSAIRLSATSGEAMVRTSVRSTSFLGGFRRYELLLGDFRLIADQPMTGLDASEPELWLSIDPAAGLHVLASRPQ